MTNRRTKVKFCGIRRPEDARLAASLGVDFVGLNFYPPSPRYVGKDAPEPLLAVLPEGLLKVGVFVDVPPERALPIAARWQLDLLQLHGGEPPESLSDYGMPVIKGLRIRDEVSLRDLERYAPDYFLLDAYRKGVPGGTGKVFDWSLALKAKERTAAPIFLAGGLTAENVAEAIRQAEPFGVDVAGGIESAPGVKDADRMRRFIDAMSCYA